MSEEEEIELVGGSGNLFRDFGDANPDIEQAKAILAARIIAILDERDRTPSDPRDRNELAASD